MGTMFIKVDKNWCD